MNRPNPKSKTKALHIKPSLYEDEQLITNFKKLCAQDNLSYLEAFKEMVAPWFVKHHLDLGGNPQRQLLSFEQTKIQCFCKCGRVAVKIGFHISSGKEQPFCKKCFGLVPLRHDSKVWRFTDL